MSTFAPLWALVPGSQGEPLAKVGGQPELVGTLRWPACRMCGVPMRFLFQLPHLPGKVDLTPYAAVYVFHCENPDTACFRTMPEEGANAAVPVLAGEPKVEGERPGGLMYHPWCLSFAEAEEDTEALAIDLNESTPGQFEAMDNASEAAPESKVGGVPVWVNGDPYFKCCGERAAFVAQLSAMPFGLEFGDCGRGYLLRCRRNPEHFRFLSQGG